MLRIISKKFKLIFEIKTSFNVDLRKIFVKVCVFLTNYQLHNHFIEGKILCRHRAVSSLMSLVKNSSLMGEVWFHGRTTNLPLQSPYCVL
jgi:hypothetical protein